VAGHQIAMNVVSLMFMLPLALAQATSTLVAQRIGAGDLIDARKLGWHGLQFGITLSGLLGAAVFLGRGELIGLYTADAAVAAATLPLLAWTALFLPADSAQTIAAFVLRAWHIAKVPMFIYAGALWGVGLIGGYALAFDLGGGTPAWLRGAPGFWFAATAGLVFAAFALAAYLIWLQRRMHTGQAAAVAH
jgi:MATE family multidrug resistance protein